VAGVPPLGAGMPRIAERTVEADGDGFVLRSAALVARLDNAGRLVSLVDTATGRDAVPAAEFGNELQLFRDTPNRWDAWDLDAAYQSMPLELRPGTASLDGDAVLVEGTAGSSEISQRITLSPDGDALEIATEVDWRERQKLLKLAFRFDVHADAAASEVQFGHLRRPIHRNTSWDVARFETCAHRWVHVAEPGFGVTVANDRVYGHDITRTTRPAGGTTTVVRESLLRAPLFPDPDADQGRHTFRHSIRIGDLLAGVAEGYRLNLPLRTLAADATHSADSADSAGSVDRPVAGSAPRPLLAVDSPAIVVEAVKLAEDGSGDVVVRLYEARGGRATGRLTPDFDTAGAVRTDLLERPLPDQPADPLRLELRPFELVTLRLHR